MSTFCIDRHLLNSCIISVHYGSNKEAVPRCWALADKEKFKHGLRKAFLKFLETCYCKYFLQLPRHRPILSLLAPDERRACALIKSGEQPLLDDDDKSVTVIIDDDPSSSMIIDTPSAPSFHTPTSTASTKDIPSSQSAPPANPSAFMASTKGNTKRKRAHERDSSQTSKKQKKQQWKKKGKHHTNTEESNEEEEEEEEEEEGEMLSDVNTSKDDSDGDEDVPLRLTTCMTARQLAKDVITDSSTLIGCNQSFTQGPQPLELPIIQPSVSEIADPSVQSRNAPLPDKGGDKPPHLVVWTSSAVLELSQPGSAAVVNKAADHSAVDSLPIDSFDQPLAKWSSLLSPPPNNL